MKTIPALFATALFGVTTAASAAPVDFGLTVQGRVGYGSNPHLVEDDNAGALLAGIRLAPQIQTRTATSTSTLSGYYDYTGYTGRYSHSDSFGVNARHEQMFSPTLSGDIYAGYIDSFNALFEPLDAIDEVTIGRRQRAVSGGGGLVYTPNGRDTWSVSGYGSHTFYPSNDPRISDYTTYGGTLGYSRLLSEATSVGVQFAVRQYDSELYSHSTSYQPSLTLRHRLSSSWTVDGHVGAIFQRSGFAGLSSHSTSLGFGANLCRQVPRSTLCFGGSRDTMPSGLGGLRTDTRATASFDYKLSERSSISTSATYGHSESASFLALTDQDYGIVRGAYNHRLTERLSIGATLDYRLQKYEGRRRLNAVAGALNITARFGRVN